MKNTRLFCLKKNKLKKYEKNKMPLKTIKIQPKSKENVNEKFPKTTKH